MARATALAPPVAANPSPPLRDTDGLSRDQWSLRDKPLNF
jgi:hypothetical protein